MFSSVHFLYGALLPLFMRDLPARGTRRDPVFGLLESLLLHPCKSLRICILSHDNAGDGAWRWARTHYPFRSAVPGQ